MYLLDTNVISEIRKAGGGKADRQVLQWLAQHDAASLYLSAITLMELELGILLRLRRDTAQGTLLRIWLQTRVLPEFADRILPINADVALRCAGLHVPDPKPERDALIAATALVHGMAVVTRNVTDFVGMGVALIDPWKPRAL